MRILSSRLPRRTAVVGTALALITALAGCGGSTNAASPADGASTSAAEDTGLMTPGKLVVGMNLQFPPEMYLDSNNQPAGYDVDLLNDLAAEMGVELEIKNLDFNGLIPGLQSKQFDMVSVGLTATDERKQVIDFSRAYVPYTSVLAVKDGDTSVTSVDSANTPGTVITALQGSSGEQLATATFPQATVTGFPDQNAALLEVATGRAKGSVVEDYILAQYSKSNPGQVMKADLPEPLDIGYGSWGVQKGNTALVTALDTYLCEAQSSGKLAELYEKNFEVPAADFPQMPAGC